MKNLTIKKKICSKCLTYKYISLFTIDIYSKTGLSSHCKYCKNGKEDPTIQNSKEVAERNISLQEEFLKKNKPKIYSQTL